jgi:hypothetical protein
MTCCSRPHPAHYEVFPRSLPFVLLSEWEQINAEADQADDVDNTTTIANFDTRLREFFQAHATADYRYELAQFLRSCHKPMNLPVHTFSYKLREFNSYIEWIPGTEPKLNDHQLKQAFHDAMPPTWRDRFANAGNTVTTLSMSQLLQYFRTQKEQASRKMQENNQQQRQRSASHRRGKKDNSTVSHLRSKKKDKTHGKILKKEKRPRIANDVPCPIHPGMGLTWGTCRANAFNEERLSKRPKKEDKNTDNTDSMIASIDQMAINDAPSETGTYSSECYINIEATIADHYMNIISFSAEQEHSKGDFVLDDAFSTICNDIYSIGGNDITLKTYTNVTASLRLRALGIMTVGSLQSTSNATPLRCFFNKAAIPPW